MADHYRQATGTPAYSRLWPNCLIHNSAGIPYWLYRDQFGATRLAYDPTYGRTAPVDLDVNVPFGDEYSTASQDHYHFSMARDTNDNIYVVIARTGAAGAVTAFVYEKTGDLPNNYLRHAPIETPNIMSNVTFLGGVQSVWCNTQPDSSPFGPATPGAGHLVVVGSASDTNAKEQFCMFSLDCNELLADSVDAVLTSSFTNPTWLVPVAASSGAHYDGFDIAQNGYGALQGATIVRFGVASYCLGSWQIDSLGTISSLGGLFYQDNTRAPSGFCKVKILSIGQSRYAFVFGNVNQKFALGRCTHNVVLNTWGQFTDPVAGRTPDPSETGFTDRWDATYDPGSGFVFCYIRQANANQVILRIGCNVAAGVVWDPAPFGLDSAFGDNNASNAIRIRCVRQTYTIHMFDFQATVTNGTNTSLGGSLDNHNVAPSAPNVSGPQPGQDIDVARSWTTAWQFGDLWFPNDYQTAYALYRKVGAGAAAYWDQTLSGGAGAFGSVGGAPVINPSAVGGLTFPAGKWTNAGALTLGVVVYDRETSGSAVTEIAFNGVASPVVTVTAMGTITFSQFSVAWTGVFGASRTQSQFQVRLFDAATYTDPDFDPEVSPPGFDSGVVSSTQPNATLNTDIEDGAWRAYVRVRQTGGLWSDWAFTPFTVALDRPAQPSLVASPVSSQGHTTLLLQGRDNIFTADEADFEASAAGWTGVTNVASTVRSAAQAGHGAASLLVTSAAAGDMKVRSPRKAVVVPVDTRIRVSIRRSGGTARQWRVVARLLDGSGNELFSKIGATRPES